MSRRGPSTLLEPHGSANAYDQAYSIALGSYLTGFCVQSSTIVQLVDATLAESVEWLAGFRIRTTRDSVDERSMHRSVWPAMLGPNFVVGCHHHIRRKKPE